MFHERTKHIDVRLHIVTQKLVEVAKIATDINPADMLTKVIPFDKFK